MDFNDLGFQEEQKDAFGDLGFMQDAPNEPRTAQDSGEALLTNLPTKGFGQSVVRSLPATVGGIIGGAAGIPLGPAGMAAGAGIGAEAGEAVRQAVSQYTATKFPEQNYPVQSPGQVLMDVGTAGASNMAGAAAPGLAAKFAGYLKRPAAQVMRAMTGVPEREGMAVLSDPSILRRALPVDEAGAAYAGATQGLQSGAKGARAALGKSHFSGEAIADKFDELMPSISNDSIDTQTLLALRQRTSKAINDLPFNQRELRGLLAENIDTMDTLLEKRLPQWEGAKTGYRESKIAEEFSSWLPLNKNLSPNVLRTTAAVAAAGKGLIEGRPLLAVALPAISPKVWGGAIRAAGAIAEQGAKLPAGTYRMASGSGASIADQYMKLRPAQ